jgi:hypothetical protein
MHSYLLSYINAFIFMMQFIPCLAGAQQNFPVTYDLISKERCVWRRPPPELSAGQLIECQIPTTSWKRPKMVTAIPLRTVLKVNREGDCSKPFPFSLEISTEVPGEMPYQLRFIENDKVIIRRRGGAPVEELKLFDSASFWTSKAAFYDSCNYSLNITFNEPDVDSKEQAQAIILNISDRLKKKAQEEQLYADLLLYSKAYLFLNDIVEIYWNQLTQERMQELRERSQTAIPLLQKMILELSVKLTDGELKLMNELYQSLRTMDDSTQWKKEDGSYMSLQEYLGNRAETILQTVNKISANQKSLEEYQRIYQQASMEKKAIEADLQLAMQQLSDKLGMQ